MKKQPLIIIAGPTAVGKTGLSVRLAQEIGGSIISADSMQVYRHMDIGSAKIKTGEMQGIPHYLIDELEPTEEFHVLRFQQMAKAALEDVRQAGRIPVLVGGTGFYIRALLYDTDFTKESGDDKYREDLNALAEKEGNKALHDRLLIVDPKAASEIHENNRKRLIRALEFHHLSGEKISEHNQEQKEKNSPYNAVYFVLNEERSRLYEKIDQRVDGMIDEGLVEEVQTLKQMGLYPDMVSMQGLGYKEILGYLDGEYSLEEAVYRIKRDTRHFAKRQLTWFRREKEAVWMEKRSFAYDEDQMLAYMLDMIRERQILKEME